MSIMHREVAAISHRSDLRRGLSPAAVPHGTAMRVLVAGGQEVFRLGLVAAAGAHPDIRVVGEVGDASQLAASHQRLGPDVVIVDLDAPGFLAAVVELVRAVPGARILAVSHFDGDEDAHRALQAGARGFFPKNLPASDILAGLRSVRGGGRSLPPAVMQRLGERIGQSELTAREREVLALICDGLTNAAIGVVLGIATGTVKIHVKSILAKLGADDRTGAAALAVRRGFVRPR
jgi:two-component system NarL family response regulator